MSKCNKCNKCIHHTPHTSIWSTGCELWGNCKYEPNNFESGRLEGIRKFAEWYFTKYFDSSQKDIDNILSEYEKEQRNEDNNK